MLNHPTVWLWRHSVVWQKLTTPLWASCKSFKTRQLRFCLVYHQEVHQPRHESYWTWRPSPQGDITFPSVCYDAKISVGEIDFEFDISSDFHSYQTRKSNDLHLPCERTSWGKQTFIFQASKDWNNLYNDIKNNKNCPFSRQSLLKLCNNA